MNFGENDGSYPTAHGQPFPTNFTDGYIALIQAIRAAYPDAHIVLLRGGMFNGAKNEIVAYRLGIRGHATGSH